MNFHQGSEFQRGRGFGSLFSGLFRRLVPIAKAGMNLGKRVLRSDFVKNLSTDDFVKNLSTQALDVGKNMVKNIAVDVLSGKSFSDSAAEELNIAKKKVGEAIRGSGHRKRKNKPMKLTNRQTKKMIQHFNLLD